MSVKVKVQPLRGLYCPSCAKTLGTENLEPGHIFPMCHSDLRQFLRNGDKDIVQRILDERSRTVSV